MKIILKWILKKQVLVMWTIFGRFQTGLVVGSYARYIQSPGINWHVNSLALRFQNVKTFLSHSCCKIAKATYLPIVSYLLYCTAYRWGSEIYPLSPDNNLTIHPKYHVPAIQIYQSLSQHWFSSLQTLSHQSAMLIQNVNSRNVQIFLDWVKDEH